MRDRTCRVSAAQVPEHAASAPEGVGGGGRARAPLGAQRQALSVATSEERAVAVGDLQTRSCLGPAVTPLSRLALAATYLHFLSVILSCVTGVPRNPKT